MTAATPTALIPPPNFNALAPVYRWMEWLSFGPFLALSRRAFLREMRDRRRALIMGDGDGRFTAQLLKDNPEIIVDAVDASPAMLRALAHRAGNNASRVRTECIDARNWKPDTATYDLIVTHYFLDCLTTEEVRTLAMRIRTAARPGASWVISEFEIPSNLFGSVVARPLVRSLYFAFRLITGLRIRHLPGYKLALKDAGFLPLHARIRLAGLLASELRTLAPEG